ncbi:MAG: hypothetical protein ACOC5T_05480 [Elusimicrobiota bacterium]
MNKIICDICKENEADRFHLQDESFDVCEECRSLFFEYYIVAIKTGINIEQILPTFLGSHVGSIKEIIEGVNNK